MAATALMALAGGSQLGTSFLEADAIKQEGAAKKSAFEMNAGMSELQAQDSIKRGDTAAAESLREAKQAKGSSRAKLAAQGIDVNSGSAMDAQDDILAAGRIDAAQIRNNARREAFGFKAEAVNQRTQGRVAELTARQKARLTILTGAVNAFGSFAKKG